MEYFLKGLIDLPPIYLFLIFLSQNLVVFILALMFGNYMLASYSQPKQKIKSKDWWVATGSVLINTIITYLGYRLWQNGHINIDFSFSLASLIDMFMLFFVMDFLMYVFHFLIHRSFLHQRIHAMHHEAINPQPIDLFVLHPIEALAFGTLWLCVLLTTTFNGWAILLYLILNVVFGIVGHLGFEPLRKTTSYTYRLSKLLGTSSFHHGHHQDINCNFGFYTSIWDRLFGTFTDKEP